MNSLNLLRLPEEEARHPLSEEQVLRNSYCACEPTTFLRVGHLAFHHNDDGSAGSDTIGVNSVQILGAKFILKISVS